MTTPTVGFVDLSSQWAEIADEVKPELDRVLSTGAYIGGAPVAAFEEAYAAYCGTTHAIGVGNGTDAVELSLRAIGVGPGDEVVIPANTFIASAEAVSRVGAVPVFCDVDPEHLLIDPASAQAAVTERTKAILPVHLFGQLAPVESITAFADAQGIAVIEDAAQSQGALRHSRRSGSLGSIAATSFYPGKNLGAAGDAGAVTTNDPALAERVRIIAAHGSRQKYVHELIGFNSRLDAVQAVVLKAKLTRLDAWNAQRQAAAEVYADLLASVDGVTVPTVAPGNEHVWHLYVVRVTERDAALRALGEAGVAAGIHYPDPVHLTTAYASARLAPGGCPVAERAAGEILSLPMHPHLRPEQQEHVAHTLIEWIKRG